MTNSALSIAVSDSAARLPLQLPLLAQLLNVIKENPSPAITIWSMATNPCYSNPNPIQITLGNLTVAYHKIVSNFHNL